MGLNWLQRAGANILGIDIIAESSGDDVFLFDPNSDFGSYTSDKRKLEAVFTNPAVLKVFKLQCDMFSLAKPYVYLDGKVKKNDPVLNLLKNPNPFQQKSQYLWDYMFWKMIGNVYCYVDSDSVASETNKSYFLDSAKITFPQYLTDSKDKIVLSNATLKAINDQLITYTYDDGTAVQFKWSRISHITDLSNGVGNWFKGKSTVDALFEIIANSRHAVKSKNINVRYAGKYMVAGKADPTNVTQMPMGDEEKLSIEQKMNGYKSVHAVKSMIDIKRFVEQAAIIGELDSSYWDDYFKIGSLYGIPKDVLEASLKGATFENQEKATGRHVDYTLSPAGELFTNALEKRFGYTNREIVLSWDHLPFTQAFAKDRATTDKLKSETLLNYMKAGVKLEEINSILDTEFSELDYEPAKRSNQTGQVAGSEGQNGQSAT